MKKSARYLLITLFVLAPVGLTLIAPGDAVGTRMMTAAEAARFKAFVNFWAEQDICWKRTVTRGVGLTPTECTAKDMDAGLCYPKCRAGFKGVGPVCWQTCPPGYNDTGGHCLKPQAYGRGSGYAWQFGDPLNDSAMFKRCEAANGQGNCEKSGAIVYPKCRAGFKATGCCVCSPVCPSGTTDIGVSCQKQSYGRGVGTIPTCRAGLDADGGLCYAKCPAGTSGVGPVCWSGCPPDMPVNCGASCAKSTAACAESIVNQVTSTGELVLNVASFITGAGPAAKAGLTAARNTARATGKKVLSKEARRAAMDAVKRKLREQAAKEGKNMSEQALENAASALEFAKEQGEFDWTMLDPTGVGEVVKAFYKPVCGEKLPSLFSGQSR
jgi:hypothetical protein